MYRNSFQSLVHQGFEGQVAKIVRVLSFIIDEVKNHLLQNSEVQKEYEVLKVLYDIKAW